MGRLRHKKRQHATLKHLCRILLEQTSHNLAAGQRTEQRVIFVNLHFHSLYFPRTCLNPQPMRKTMAATAATTMLSVPTARAMCAPSRALEILAAVVLHSRWFLVGAERGRRGMVRCQVLTRSAPFLLPGQHRVLSRRAVPSAHARLCHL
ncbi:uncharacterized protein LOC142557748 isoform X1 [Dermacentor variabilis]|uniref:uncharacterized protein LOC142557748 isoform X1 n=1 Tax=Dermacentor variabilis TaxID=34621 RepID=UPI003F5B8D4B